MTTTLTAPAPLADTSYVEFNTDITITATTDITAQTIVTAASFTPNGTDAFWIEFWCEAVNPGSSVGAAIIFVLYDNGTILGTPRIAQVNTPAASTLVVPVYARIKITPTNAAHVYDVRAYRVTANGTVLGSNSATGRPGAIRISRAF